MSKITSLTIDRKRWATGADGGYLLNVYNRKMCCLGFFCRAAGLQPKQIRNVAMPSDLCDTDSDSGLKNISTLETITKRDGNDKKVTAALADINDSTEEKFSKNPKLRETRITNLFARLGVKVKFIN